MKLVIAGGGTGGHLFPGIAVAEAFLDMAPQAEVLFVGTDRGIEKTAVPKAGFNLKTIQIGGLKGLSWSKKISTLTRLPFSVVDSMRILRAFGPDAVLGVGGYASGPVLLAAWLMGMPTAICEQNSVPGMTNRFLGKLVRRVFGTFRHSAQFFPQPKFQLVGNPVRQSIAGAQPKKAGAAEDRPHRLLVLGGSQGARPLNERVPQAMAQLVQAGLKVEVIHQTGKRELEDVRGRYAELAVEATAISFIDDMVEAYQNADVVICRAGATTCAEVAIVGRPAIFVPFPFATDDHQTLNAREFADADAGILMPQSELSPENLASTIGEVLADADMRHRLAQNARRLAHPHAASDVASAAAHGFANGNGGQATEKSAQEVPS